jgi:dephospho-CoA kinase
VQELSILKGPHRLVIGAGIGAGKSVVTRLLAERGAVVIEADHVGHLVIEPQGRAFAAVVTRWPEVLVDGMIDRSALAAIVFDDSHELADLERITHSAIASEIAGRVVAAGSAPVVVEVPVLAAIVGEEWVRVWVSAPVETRAARAVGRGMDEADVRRRVESQASDIEWAEWADHVLVNDGTYDELVAGVEHLVSALSQEP